MTAQVPSAAGRLAVVVGGLRGIGAATAAALHGSGWRVVVTSRTGTPARPFPVVACDVRSAAGVRAAFAAIIRDFGEPDAVVVNAGVRRDRLLAMMTDADFDAVLNTNLVGAWRVAAAVLPGMVRRGWGRLVFVSSVAAVRGERGQVNYASSKAALGGLSRALARQVARDGVTVNAVLPGLVDTDLTADLTPEARRRIIDRVPCGRAGLPSEIAAAITFLTDEKAAHITGALIPVDGGLSLGW